MKRRTHSIAPFATNRHTESFHEENVEIWRNNSILFKHEIFGKSYQCLMCDDTFSKNQILQKSTLKWFLCGLQCCS